MPNKPSTEGAAREDEWTRYCLEIAGRRAFGRVLLGALAFTLQLVMIFILHVSSQFPVTLLALAAAVLGGELLRGRPLTEVLADHAWRYVRVHWRGGLLVVHGTRSLVLDVSAGPVARGRIRRHRRAWLVPPDRYGNTVVAFRGVPRLFPAKVRRR